MVAALVKEVSQIFYKMFAPLLLTYEPGSLLAGSWARPLRSARKLVSVPV
jgi:hypothetical protein